MTRAAWCSERSRRCAVCGQRGRLERHHVIREQVIRRERGEVYDPRNALDVCPACHPDGARGGRRLAAVHVPDAAIEFAVELLGPGKAFNELVRWYDGAAEDPRIEPLAGA